MFVTWQTSRAHNWLVNVQNSKILIIDPFVFSCRLIISTIWQTYAEILLHDNPTLDNLFV